MHWERKNIISFRGESIYLGQSLHKEGLQDLYSLATKIRCVDIQFSLFTYCIPINKPLNLQTRESHSRQRILVSLTLKCGNQFAFPSTNKSSSRFLLLQQSEPVLPLLGMLRELRSTFFRSEVRWRVVCTLQKQAFTWMRGLGEIFP